MEVAQGRGGAKTSRGGAGAKISRGGAGVPPAIVLVVVLTFAFVFAACPRKADVTTLDAGVATVDVPVVVEDARAEIDEPRKAAPGRAKLIPITKNGVGPMGAGAVNRAAVARVFLDGLKGNIEETNDITENEVVGRAYTVRRGEGVDVVTEAIVHADTDGNLYSVEIVAPIAEARGVTVGDPLGKALGDEPVKCAPGVEERAGRAYCARRAEPSVLFEVAAAEGTNPEKMRALPIRAILWNPHAR